MRCLRLPIPLAQNRDVIELLDSGFSVEVVIAKIEASPCAFETSITELKQLKAAGVPDTVIRAMVKARA